MCSSDLAVLTRLLGSGLPEYTTFMIASGSSIAGCVAGTYLTTPTDTTVLEHFYKITRPFGFWGSIRKTMEAASLTAIHAENRRDIIALFFAVPWQIVLFLTGMMIVLKQWSNAGILAVLLIPLSAGLYWFWYRHLSKEAEVE